MHISIISALCGAAVAGFDDRCRQAVLNFNNSAFIGLWTREISSSGRLLLDRGLLTLAACNNQNCGTQCHVKIAFHHSCLSSKSSDAELMQYRRPDGCGPSSKTWPRCASQAAHATSILAMPCVSSVFVRTASPANGSQKLGQPERESYLFSELKSGASQQTHRYVPSAL